LAPTYGAVRVALNISNSASNPRTYIGLVAGTLCGCMYNSSVLPMAVLVQLIKDIISHPVGSMSLAHGVIVMAMDLQL